MRDKALAWAAWHPIKGFGETPNARWDIDDAINDAKCQSILDDSPDWIAVRVEIRRKDAAISLGRCQRLGRCGFPENCICDTEPDQKDAANAR